MSKQPEKISDYSIFMPRSANGLFYDYPEMRNIEEFKGLQNDDILFVWYFACEASPFFMIRSDTERAKQAMSKSYTRKGEDKYPKAAQQKILAGQFPEKVQEAIRRMRSYKIGPRIVAKKALEKMFNNVLAIVDIDVKDTSHFLNAQGEVDFGKKKAYVDTVKSASDQLPKLIAQMEEGFHVVEKDKKEGASDEDSFLDSFHDEEN